MVGRPVSWKYLTNRVHVNVHHKDCVSQLLVDNILVLELDLIPSRLVNWIAKAFWRDPNYVLHRQDSEQGYLRFQLQCYSHVLPIAWLNAIKLQLSLFSEKDHRFVCFSNCTSKTEICSRN